MATYPSAVKSFTSKADGAGNKIFAAHINDLQDEVTAIESGLLTGTAPVSASNVTVNSLQVSSNSTVAANLIVGGSLSVSSNSTIAGDLFVGKQPPNVHAYMPSTVSTPNNTPTGINFTQEINIYPAAGGQHSTGANSSRFVATSSGVWMASAYVEWAGFSTVGIREIVLWYNDTLAVFKQRGRADPTPGNASGQSIALTHVMNQNDYFTLVVTQDSGSTGSLSSAARFNWVKIR